MIQQAIDLSNFYGYVQQDWANAVVAAGIQRVTVRCSLERPSFVDIALHQIAVFHNAGATVDGYVWCYQKADDPDALAARVQAAYGAMGLPIYWLDLEDEDGWSYDTPAENIDWLDRALAGFDTLRLPVGIYSGRWYWVKANRYANTPMFSDRLLWASQFDLIPNRNVFAAFGGWENCTGKQWCGESSGPEANVAGVNVDRSVWESSLLPDGGNGDEPMTARQMEIARVEIAGNILKALQYKLPKKAREALEAGALPAAYTLSRGEE